MQANRTLRMDKAAGDAGNRYSIAGVRIERDEVNGPVAVATNGRVLAIARVELAETDHVPAIVPSEAWAGLCAGKGPTMLDLNGKATLRRMDKAGTQTFDLIDARFPEWKQGIVPPKTAKAHCVLTLDASQLMRLAQALGSGKEGQFFTLTIPTDSIDKDGKTVTGVMRADTDHGYGAIMPAK